MARQCLVTEIMHQPKVESSTSTEGGAHSNQGSRSYLQIRFQKGQNVRGWRKLL